MAEDLFVGVTVGFRLLFVFLDLEAGTHHKFRLEWITT